MLKLFELSEMTPGNNANAIAHEYAEMCFEHFFGYATKDFETLCNFLSAQHIFFDNVGKPYIVNRYYFS